MTAKDLLPVTWREGMFLRPQHFQQRDLFEAERLSYHLRAMDPFHWGVRDLQVDEKALSDNRFELLRLDAVLPSGRIARYPGNAILHPREFSPEVEQIDVHLGVRRPNRTDRNAEPDTGQPSTVGDLYRSEEVSDLNGESTPAPIDVSYANLRILLSGEEQELAEYDSIKLAEVVRTGSNAFEISPHFAPALLALQAFPPLFDDVRQLVSQLGAKVRVVAGRTQTIAIAELPRMWMRYTLSRMTPVLRHWMSLDETRPFEVYTALLEAGAALAAFRSLEPADLPQYDHGDLRGCFNRLIRFIEAQLEEAVPERFHEFSMPFDGAKKCYATNELTVELVHPRNLFYLGINAEIDSAELADLVVEHAKASSIGGISALVMLNTKGLRIERLPAAPTEIAARPGFEYFKIEPHGPQWKKVADDYSLAVNLGKLEGAETRLYVVAPEA